LEFIIGELAPLLLDFAFELFPVAFDLIPIHLTPAFRGNCELLIPGERISGHIYRGKAPAPPSGPAWQGGQR
jgi:hypothetical protein